jgi:hypothetical protein
MDRAIYQILCKNSIILAAFGNQATLLITWNHNRSRSLCLEMTPPLGKQFANENHHE